MGSENNMVAVPVEPTRAMYDAAYAAFGSSWPNFKSMYAEILRAARLAQPDAQQGAPSPASGEGVEECPHEAWNENGLSRRCVDCGKSLPEATPLAAATQPAVSQEGCDRTHQLDVGAEAAAPHCDWAEIMPDGSERYLFVAAGTQQAVPQELERLRKALEDAADALAEIQQEATPAGNVWKGDEPSFQSIVVRLAHDAGEMAIAALTGARENGEQRA